MSNEPSWLVVLSAFLIVLCMFLLIEVMSWHRWWNSMLTRLRWSEEYFWLRVNKSTGEENSGFVKAVTPEQLGKILPPKGGSGTAPPENPNGK